jgi:ubiquinone/menaquinone biosynthesis C-methylase UbiE
MSQPDEVLNELHRVLKPGGVLSFNDHHLKEASAVIARITGRGRFQLSAKGKRVYNFIKV